MIGAHSPGKAAIADLGLPTLARRAHGPRFRPRTDGMSEAAARGGGMQFRGEERAAVDGEQRLSRAASEPRDRPAT